ncbi:MAG: hypothetical protein FWH37_01695 [Candidatus Bathyarchaeota archaeon]|nr:hypothetical protein [Candidatus Termiticorpusculum sp.]
MFANWVSELKSGNLDHRSWIFENIVVIKIINAYKTVKKGKTPENGILDIGEPWTIRDLYFLHPMVKDPTFWRDLLTGINLRIKHIHKNKKLYKHISAVIDGAY